MASDKEYLEYVSELLKEVGNVTYKKMMGEFLLYSGGVLFGGVYDNRFLIKKTPSVATIGLSEELPYDGAKPMLIIDTEDPIEIKSLVEKVIDDLKN